MVGHELVSQYAVRCEYRNGIHYISFNVTKIVYMKYTYPHTIDNGGGEQITFVNFIDNDEGGKLEIENRVQPGAGPPMHVHFLQEECLTVVQGKIGAQIAGQQPTFHGPGETITFKRGVAHRFWNAGDEILLCKGWASPANNLEYFLTEIFRSTKQNGGARPSAFDGAFLQAKYGTEVELLEIPVFVKKVVLPITLTLGKLAGYHRKFDGAPDAVTAA
jgi:quercetin dioxygenase-like cupin family protein